MPKSGGRQVLAVLPGLVAVPLGGREKWSLIPSSDAIVRGRINRIWRLPWFDGWHLRGTLRVERVLKGNVQAGTVFAYCFRCQKCGANDVWHLHADHYKPSIWYLRKDGSGGWISASATNDMGQRSIDELPALIEMLKRPDANGI